MNGDSLNITQDLLLKLKEIVPQAFSEEKIDIQKLQTLLGDDAHIEGERYQLTWAGKSEAYKVLQMPSTATLIPQPEQSVNWDESENIFIEGENLEVLKVLQKSYYGKIKMIYIDPPYNTGNDSFIYPDKFSETKEEYLKRIGEKDEEGYMMKEGLFRKNRKENGQFHSNWLNMMLPRLFLAHNLLKEDGVIFVSIDDNEQANLKMLMDEIFGEDNFSGCIVWQKKYGPANDAKGISNTHEYILCYSKNFEKWQPELFPRNEEQLKAFNNPDNDPRGNWRASDLSARTYSKSCDYPITIPSGKVVYPPPSRSWIVNETKYKELVEDNRIWFGVEGTARPMQKKFLTEVKIGITPQTWWGRDFAGDNKTARYEIKEIFPENVFETPKPTTLIKRILQVANTKKDSIILDFFVGSGTTAQAVLDLNEDDDGNRKFICVQLPEVTDEESTASKAGYKTISSIAENRIKITIKRLLKKRKEELSIGSLPNLGFRKYTLSSSNFKIWRGDVVENEGELTKQMELFVTPQKDNAQTENILWELLIKNGVPLTEKIQRIEVGSAASIYHTSDKRFAFVLDKFTAEVQERVISLKPRTVICLDSLFQNQDMVKTNAQLKFEDNDITFKTV